METPDQKLEEISKDLTVIEQEADTYIIQTPNDVGLATNFLVKVKEQAKNIEKIRKFFVDPLNKQVKEINGLFNPKIEILEGVESKVKRLIGNYAMEQEKIRRDEERKLQEAHAKEMAKLEKKADKKGEEFIPTVAPTIQEAPKTIQSEIGKTTTIKVWKFEILDNQKVPREFCEPVDSLIRNAVKNGIREIEGVRIYEDVQVKIS